MRFACKSVFQLSVINPKSKQSQPPSTANVNKQFNIVNQYEHTAKTHKWCYDKGFINVFIGGQILFELIFLKK